MKRHELVLIKKYKEKLMEELSLISDEVFDIGEELETDSGDLAEQREQAELAFYACLRETGTQILVQAKSIDAGILFTYSVLLRKLENTDANSLLRLIAKNWSLEEVFLWTQEINDEWYLLGSTKRVFESYLPGQIKSQLDKILIEVGAIGLK